MFEGRALAAWTAATALCLTACHSSSSGSPAPRYPGLVGVSIAPADTSIPKGIAVQFTATGTFEDSRTEDLTTAVAWSSTDAAVAAFAAAAGTEGLASTATTGSVTVGASVDGVAGTTTLTVLDAAVETLELSPAAPTILVGTSLKLAAIANLTDDSTFELSLATWSSSDTSVVVVGSDGTVYAQALGSATITAIEPTTGISASTLVTVTPIPGLLSYVSVRPGSVVGGARTATGTVALTSAPTLPTTVTLSSDVAAAIPAPAQIVFDSTASPVATFVVTTNAVQQRTRARISATADGDVNAGVEKVATLRIRPAK